LSHSYGAMYTAIEYAGQERPKVKEGTQACEDLSAVSEYM